MDEPEYNRAFFNTLSSGSLRSAQATLRIIYEVFKPKSVVDVGCGTGEWLKVWSELGVEEILGLDGGYVSRSQLLIPPDRFKPMDLSAPSPLSQQFDLVQSLEVAEHLPRKVADRFVDFLCSLAPVVLFSAAIPQQGGTHHLNEQWPEYWADLFAKRGFVTIDTLRARIWEDPNVDYWYRQNILFFVREGQRSTIEKLQAIRSDSQSSLNKVHPTPWLISKGAPSDGIGIGTLVKMMPASLAGTIRRRMGFQKQKPKA